MKKSKLFFILTILCAMLFLVSCSNDTTTPSDNSSEKIEVSVATLKAPTGMGMVQLMENNSKVNDYQFTLATAPDDIIGEVIAGNIDIAAVPTNLAATLYQRTQGSIEIAAVNTLGVLYILENSDSIQGMGDLAGKQILSAGQGTTAEYVINYLLTQNGLALGENVVIDYASEHAEVATQAQAGNYDVVILPEPYATSLMTQDNAFHIAIDVTEEWETLGNGALAMGGVIVQKSFAEEHPEALAAFMEEYQDSVDFVNENPTEAATLMETYDIIKADVAEKAIPNCNIVCITGEEAKTALESFYQVLLEANPQSIGGAMPGDDFYLTNF